LGRFDREDRFKHFGLELDATLHFQTKTLRSRKWNATFPSVFRRIMMQMTQGWIRLRSVAIALGLFAWAGMTARADGILTYGTSGFVTGTSGVSGTNVITYESITNATVDTSSNLQLGSFQVAAVTPDATTTYTDTPFEINVLPSAYNNDPLSSFTPLKITGVLNGSVSDNQSNVIATLTVPNNTFTLGDATSTLAGLPSTLLIVPSSSNGGTTTIEAAISTVGTVNPQAPVPEPSSIALFLTTVGGLALRRYVQVRRQRATA
jgi:hypothetical protein